MDSQGELMRLAALCASLQGAVVGSLTVHGPQSLLPLTFKGTERHGTGAEGQIIELVLRSGGTSGSFSEPSALV